MLLSFLVLPGKPKSRAKANHEEGALQGRQYLSSYLIYFINAKNMAVVWLVKTTNVHEGEVTNISVVVAPGK